MRDIQAFFYDRLARGLIIPDYLVLPESEHTEALPLNVKVTLQHDSSNPSSLEEAAPDHLIDKEVRDVKVYSERTDFRAETKQGTVIHFVEGISPEVIYQFTQQQKKLIIIDPKTIIFASARDTEEDIFIRYLIKLVGIKNLKLLYDGNSKCVREVRAEKRTGGHAIHIIFSTTSSVRFRINMGNVADEVLYMELRSIDLLKLTNLVNDFLSQNHTTPKKDGDKPTEGIFLSLI